MRKTHFPYGTLLLCTLTLAYSMYVAVQVTGRPMGTVDIRRLEPYGAVTVKHLRDLEVWRLVAAQLIHAKQLHMLYNVLSLALLGALLERKPGPVWWIGLWFIAGSVGTVVSTWFTQSPWNLGTGASQAVVGLAGYGLTQVGTDAGSKALVAVLCVTLLPAFALDLVHAGHPKPGHVAAVAVGVLAGFTQRFIAARSAQSRDLAR